MEVLLARIEVVLILPAVESTVAAQRRYGKDLNLLLLDNLGSLGEVGFLSPEKLCLLLLKVLCAASVASVDSLDETARSQDGLETPSHTEHAPLRLHVDRHFALSLTVLLGLATGLTRMAKD